MPDIQAGAVEMTRAEAVRERQQEPTHASDASASLMRVDELGDVHDESAYNHLGRS